MKLNPQMLLAFGILAWLNMGCATLTKAPLAEVRLNSTPRSVNVMINGYDQGKTPLTVQLDRKKNHNVTFMIPGSQPIHVQIRPKLDVATTLLGNLVSWNVLGVVVDLATGHAYTLTPSDIQQNVESISKTFQIESSRRELTVVLFTKTEWDQVKGTSAAPALSQNGLR